VTETPHNSLHLPPIEELSALQPVNQGLGASALRYEGIKTDLHNKDGRVVPIDARQANGAMQSEVGELLSTIYEHEPHELTRWSVVNNPESTDIEADSAAAELAKYYMIRCAKKLHEKDGNGAVWAERFTRASFEYYGEIDLHEAAAQTSARLEEIRSVDVDGDEHARIVQQQLIDEYTRSIGTVFEDGQPIESSLSGIEGALQPIQDFLFQRYGEVLGLIDVNAVYAPEDIVKVLQDAIALMARDDPTWNKWSVKLVDQAHLSVRNKDPDDLSILVGKHRPASDGLTMLGVFGHEFLWHAVRAHNGWKHGPKMGGGLPNYDAFEEGGGVLYEIALTGVVPRKNVDRYIDIARASGALDGTRRTRQEMIDFVIERETLLAYGRGVPFNVDDITRRAYSHVDRMYKGGPGDDSDAGLAVFTKDTIYHDGLSQAFAYFRTKIAEGYTVEQLVDYLEQGKLVPTERSHVEYARNNYGIELQPLAA